MKFIVQIIFIAGGCYVAELFFPWWSIAVVSFLMAAMIFSNGLIAFLSGFLGVGMLWSFFAWKIDQDTNSILTNKIAVLFELEQPFILLVATGIIGALVGGFAALSGSHFRSLFKKKKEEDMYYYPPQGGRMY